jgi:Bacterial SCP ortholog
VSAARTFPVDGSASGASSLPGGLPSTPVGQEFDGTPPVTSGSGTTGADPVREWLAGGAEPERSVVRAAVKGSLAAIAAAAPGRSVEVRVPPFGAVQCISGPRHGRGTPPNVVEAGPRTWLALVTGTLTWEEARESGALIASGTRSAEVSRLLPLT